MKKIVILFTLILFFSSGCTSSEEKAEKETITTLESFGLSNEAANDFYGYANSSRLIFLTMTDINNSIKDNDYSIEDDQYKTLLIATETLEEYFSNLNPDKTDELKEYLTNKDNTIRSPLLIIDNIQDNQRTFTIAEASMVWSNMVHFATEALSTQNLTENNLKKIIQWFHDNNEYSDLFNEVYEFRTK